MKKDRAGSGERVCGDDVIISFKVIRESLPEG